MYDSTLHPAAHDEDRLLRQCDVRRERRSGPGGQHRNKVETAVVITHQPTGITGSASERRSQAQNRAVAVFRLRVNLALHVRSAASPSNVPSDLWRSRLAGGRIHVSSEHVDFPTLLAEALDVLHANNVDVKTAALALGCSVSQLTKFLKLEPKALQHVNEHRKQLGLRPMH